jgi:hypothetical protein
MEFENKKLRDVAEIARQIMFGEQLKGGQVKLDKNHNGKIDGQDFKILKGQKKPVAEAKYEESEKDEKEDMKGEKETGMSDAEYEKSSKDKKEDKEGEKKMKEEVEQIEERDEGKPGLMFKKIAAKAAKEYGSKEAGARVAGAIRKKVLAKEDTVDQAAETILEYKSKDGVYKHEGTYGREKSAEAGETDWKKEDKLAKTLDKKPVMKGARQNRNFNTKAYKESFAGIIDSYSKGGLKGLFEALKKNEVIVEEPDSEQFAQEVKTAQDKSEGKGKKAEVAAAGVKAVKQEGVEVVEYPLDANEINGYSEVTIGESVEQIEELSKNTLGSYIKKANYAGGMADFKHGRIADKRGDSKEKTSLAATAHKREKGISTAVDKLSKEEVEPTQLMSFKARYKK